jgi:hypothetical protein
MVTDIRSALKLFQSRIFQSGEILHRDSSDRRRSRQFSTVDEKTLGVQQGMERVVDRH